VFGKLCGAKGAREEAALVLVWLELDHERAL
jgi:hypothetical protein